MCRQHLPAGTPATACVPACPRAFRRFAAAWLPGCLHSVMKTLHPTPDRPTPPPAHRALSSLRSRLGCPVTESHRMKAFRLSGDMRTSCRRGRPQEETGRFEGSSAAVATRPARDGSQLLMQGRSQALCNMALVIGRHACPLGLLHGASSDVQAAGFPISVQCCHRMCSRRAGSQPIQCKCSQVEPRHRGAAASQRKNGLPRGSTHLDCKPQVVHQCLPQLVVVQQCGLQGSAYL